MHTATMDEDREAHGLRGPVALSLATHVVALSLALFVHGSRPLSQPQIPDWLLGYKGKGHDARRLDLLQANALRFRIFQPAVGTGSAARAAPAANAAQRDDRVRTGTKQAPAAPGGVRPARTAPAAARSDAEIGLEAVPMPQVAGAPALQPDVALSDELSIIRLVKPVYPEHELAAGVRADVLIAIHVAPAGDIDDALVRQAVTDPPGSTRAFELTALEALRQWRVHLPPGEGYANGCWLTVPIEYRPEDETFDRLRDNFKPEPGTSPFVDETAR